MANKAGVGLLLIQQGNALIVSGCVPGGPCYGQNIQSGDELISVNGAAVGDTIQSAAGLLAGPPGTVVSIAFKRGEELNTITVQRSLLSASHANSQKAIALLRDEFGSDGNGIIASPMGTNSLKSPSNLRAVSQSPVRQRPVVSSTSPMAAGTSSASSMQQQRARPTSMSPARTRGSQLSPMSSPNSNSNSNIIVNSSNTPPTANGMDLALSRESGLGLSLARRRDGELYVTEIADGSGAAKSGFVKVGDVIATVDGIDVLGKQVSEVAPLILGPEGTVVTLGVLRGPASRGRYLVGQIERRVNRPEAAAALHQLQQNAIRSVTNKVTESPNSVKSLSLASATKKGTPTAAVGPNVARFMHDSSSSTVATEEAPQWARDLDALLQLRHNNALSDAEYEEQKNDILRRRVQRDEEEERIRRQRHHEEERKRKLKEARDCGAITEERYCELMRELLGV